MLDDIETYLHVYIHKGSKINLECFFRDHYRLSYRVGVAYQLVIAKVLTIVMLSISLEEQLVET